MDKLLAVLLFVTAMGVVIFAQPACPLAVLFGSFCTIIAVFWINKRFEGEERIFLRRLFIIALLLRVALATATYVYNLQDFFGGDSLTYDNAGYVLSNYWLGYANELNGYRTTFAPRAQGSGFGMAYIVAGIYTVIGRNLLATQFLNCVLGATTSCLIYICAKNIFINTRVAKNAAILVGVFPSLILWSSQGLKDGIICFLLAFAINLLFSLQKRLNYFNILLLLIALVGIYTLRFYIFYAFVIAILGAFFLSAQKSAASIGKQIVVLIFITIGLTYLGVLQNAQENFDRFGNLETLQNSRLDQSRSAQSGFGQDIDVSTPTGAIQAIPIGLFYLMLAPFPWEVSNFRQAITLPEVFAWWFLVPFMGIGIWFTLKNKLRESVAIILLTLLLTISYAIFQGNVGTAYRMRAQMQIFYFIFVAVGLTLWQEKRENKNFSMKRRIPRRVNT